jgi:uncharacterized protein
VIMEYRFFAYGHANVRALHKTTLEFTKDTDLTAEGDCIVGVKADFDPLKLREFIKSCGENRMRMTILITVGKKKYEETIEARPNTLFNDAHELVIRKTDFRSGRTLAMHANKSSFEFDREMVQSLQNPAQKVEIVLETL